MPKEFNFCAHPQGGCTASWNQHIPQYFPYCYLHASMSMIQDRIKMALHGKGVPDVQLSRQDVLDCAGEYGYGANEGGGGEGVDVMEYMRQYGIPDETCNIYSGIPKNKCDVEKRCMNCMVVGDDQITHCWPVPNYVKYRVKDYGFVRGEQAMMSEILQRGPISCGMVIDDEFLYNYGGGVYQDKNNLTEVAMDHDVEVSEHNPTMTLPTTSPRLLMYLRNCHGIFILHVIIIFHVIIVIHVILMNLALTPCLPDFFCLQVIGWGEQLQKDGTVRKYWLVRNSHGTYFGVNGMFLIERGVNSMRIEEKCLFANPDIRELESHLRGETIGSMFGLLKPGEKHQFKPNDWNTRPHKFPTKEEKAAEAAEEKREDDWVKENVPQPPLELRGSVVGKEQGVRGVAGEKKVVTAESSGISSFVLGGLVVAVIGGAVYYYFIRKPQHGYDSIPTH